MLKPTSPDLVEAIRQVCLDEEPTTPLFYLVEYSYADLLVKEGKFISPCGAYTSCSECRELIQQSSYSHIPLAVIRNSPVEVFDGDTKPSKQGRTVPLRILDPGEMFGVWETLDYLIGAKYPAPHYSLSAGARSVWILAPLGDVRLPRLLNEVAGSDVDWERNESHWSLIQSATKKASQWKLSIIVFAEAFIRLLKDKRDSESTFRRIVLEAGWKQSSALRHTAVKNAQLRAWFLGGPAKSIPLPFGELYQFATICHLLSIAEGDYPAYQSIGISKQELGPFETFERLLDEALAALKVKAPSAPRYYPVIMQPGHLTKQHSTGYYSFRCPSLLGADVPEIANFSDTPGPISKTIQSLYESKSGYSIDLEKTCFYSQAGRFDLKRPDSRLPWRELHKHVPEKSRKNLYTDSPFMVAGVRLVRV
jgi:hypothetical protein